ncbi:hypothetical protein POM88_031227 [Heracleum sosnowskyi]|uniref:Uncharacterized protein n=1 Tax=Heracleum sosnowskyi TaxID=360622 RepID=A0AAD8MJK0_9APIA|nr:hypothetical protein POM88_031227 [Heracleum sosnowskyi]
MLTENTLPHEDKKNMDEPSAKKRGRPKKLNSSAPILINQDVQSLKKRGRPKKQNNMNVQLNCQPELIAEEYHFDNPNEEADGDDFSSEGQSENVFSGDSDSDNHSDNHHEDDRNGNTEPNEQHFTTFGEQSFGTDSFGSKDPFVELNVGRRHLPICSEYRSLGGPTYKCTHCNAQIRFTEVSYLRERAILTPTNKINMMTNVKFDSLDSVDDSKYEWTIKVRVIRIWDTYSTRGDKEFKGRNMLLLDDKYSSTYSMPKSESITPSVQICESKTPDTGKSTTSNRLKRLNDGTVISITDLDEHSHVDDNEKQPKPFTLKHIKKEKVIKIINFKIHLCQKVAYSEVTLLK